MTMNTEEHLTGRRVRSIQSVKTGFSILRVLSAANHKMSLTKIAAAAEMAPAKVHLYLATFSQIGLVVQDPATMHYGLGPAAIQVGAAAIRQLDLMSIVREPMNQIQTETGEIVCLSVWGDQGPVVIHKLDGISKTPMTVRVGASLSLLHNASGHLFYAFARERFWRSVLDQELQQTQNRDVLSSMDIRKIRAEKISSAALVDGYTAIAAPIFDHNEEIVATFSVVGGPVDDQTLQFKLISRSVKKAAECASHAFGRLKQCTS